MNCPHCQKELPEAYGMTPCPFCGKEIYFEHIPIPPNRLRMNWRAFFVVLLAPAVLTMIGMLTNTDSIIFGSTFAGSVVAGIICGRMLAYCREMPMWLAVLLVLALIVTSFIFCFLGCAISIPLHRR